jgi:hypothetical protein
MIAPPHLQRVRSGTPGLQTAALRTATVAPLRQHQSPTEQHHAAQSPDAINEAVLRYLDTLP